MSLSKRPSPRSPQNAGEGAQAACKKSARDAGDAHLLVGQPAAVDDDVVVERDGAVAHRHVVMPLGGALAAALRVRAGREQEVAGKAAGARVVALRIVAVERDRIPAALRVEPPAEMRDGVTVHVVGARPVAVEPVAHQLWVETALALAGEGVAGR